jgi:hypothetical protein
LVAAITRTSIGTGRFAPTRDHLALLVRGQQLGLEVERQVADLVEEQVPPSAACRRPIRSPRCVGETPLTVGPNQLRTRRGFRYRCRGRPETMTLVARRGSAVEARCADELLCRCRS